MIKIYHPDMSLYRKDHFELMATEEKNRQEGLSVLPHLPKIRTQIPLVKMPSPYSFHTRKKTALIMRDRESTKRNLHKQTLLNNSYLPIHLPPQLLHLEAPGEQ